MNDFSETTSHDESMTIGKTGRPSKRGKALNIKLDADVHNLLVRHCEITGQTKTVAVERALKAYCQTDRTE